MKKLMIAAIAAATVGGAFAEPPPCTYTQEAPKDTAWVYKWTFSGKTTEGVMPKEVKGTTGVCDYHTDPKEAGCAVRVPASLKIEGYTWACTPGCGSEAFESFVEANEIFWQKKPFKAALAGGVDTQLSNIIGKKATQFEAAGYATLTEQVEKGTYVLLYAGLGKYDTKNSRVKSVSGNFAGALSQPWYIANTACTQAGYWNCETLDLVCPGGATVAYGKWSAKFNSSAAKKYLNKGTLPKAAAWADPTLNGTK